MFGIAPAFIGRAASGGGGPSDPYWANVISLLSCGVDFTDAKGKIWTPNGSASIVTDVNAFTGKSCYLNGGWLTTPDSTDWAFGTGNFTLEAFIRPVSHAAFGALFIKRATSSGTPPFDICFNNTAHSLDLLASVDGANWTVLQTSTNVLTMNARVHVAVVRNGAGITLYVGGVAWATDATHLGVQSLWVNTAPMCLGANGDGSQNIVCYLDQFRATKGVARYTSNFTPPTAAFPSH
jgi:hypothetical protein